jgi:hypothetical protein
MVQEKGHFQIFLCETLEHQVNKERNKVGLLSVGSVRVPLCVLPTKRLALKFP